ncbi:MAG: indolepyruvate oxidoreductase subunit beta [Candidatus Krumholzibacteria bacterium]|nr:indolepyruvate oxidoreductase subunit beta [Candidatus Krumholzibacteria bacterium]
MTGAGKPTGAKKRRHTPPQTVNVLMAGVGGQGVLIASETLALAALCEGLETKQSEVHGVAQRGGSVVSHVRFGPRVFSPLIRCGEVDVLYAMERLEALRYAHYVKPGGTVVMNDHVIKPIQLSDEPERPYPQEVPEFLLDKGYDVLVIPALPRAIELGDKRCANVVLLGVLATRLGLREASWQTALAKRFSPQILDLNTRAFADGRRLAIDLTSKT